jgi:hypothetical protein
MPSLLTAVSIFAQNAHCIGDRANKVVLDAMEAAIAKYGPADRRLRIEHSQIMTEDDLARAVRLGGKTNSDLSTIVNALTTASFSDCKLSANACYIRRE